jgi:sialic acid synthase SpsE
MIFSNTTNYLIAEIGINHSGSAEIACLLIRRAAESGANAVKFQYRNLDNIYGSRQVEIGDEILAAEIERNHLHPSTILELTREAKKLGLDVGISFFSEWDIHDFGGHTADFDFFKIPSVELGNASLKAALIATGMPIIISLGAHSQEEIEYHLRGIPESRCILMHCVSNYPVAYHNARLGYIKYLKENYRCIIGYSSHDDSWEVCIAALAFGASVVERHITTNKQQKGLDHSSSSTPEEFEKLSLLMKAWPDLTLGNGPRYVNQGELINRQNLGRTAYAKRDLIKGEVVSPSDVVFLSPAVGLSYSDIDYIRKTPLVNSVSRLSPIRKSDFTAFEEIPDTVSELINSNRVALPARLHDLKDIKKQFGARHLELHMSYGEINEIRDLKWLPPNTYFSVHIPDYINSTQLLDIFSGNLEQRDASRRLVSQCVSLAESIAERSDNFVPIVCSFTSQDSSQNQFYQHLLEYLTMIPQYNCKIYPQLLPPFAWYFGGSVRLNNFNSPDALEAIRTLGLEYCWDTSHSFMCSAYYGQDYLEQLKRTTHLVQHIHIAGAQGIDGEGTRINKCSNLQKQLIREALKFDCMKVIEVWQGHLDNFAGFKDSYKDLHELLLET